MRLVFWAAGNGYLAYLLWEPYGWVGEIPVVIVAALWGLEIMRGNQTEDYIFENYENPVQE